MPRPCLICSAPFDVVHFSVEACRACAEFFKRTVLSGRKYVCRQGDRKCPITRSDSGKFVCRSCRFDKCVQIGMEYELPRRKLKRKKSNAVDDSPVASTSASSIVSDTCKTPLLDRIEEAYKEFISLRLEQEREYVAKRNLPRLSTHPNEELYIGDFTALCDCFRMAVKVSTPIMKPFDEFDSFPIEHRVTLFKNYTFKFGFIDFARLAAKYFEKPTHFMASLITCAEFAKMDQWIVEEKSSLKRNAIQSTVKGFSAEFEELHKPMIRVDDLTDREFYAIMGLCYCDVDTLQLPDEIFNSAQITRAQIYEELQEYYQNELKLNDYSKKIGNLMTLVHGTREAELLTNQVMRTYASMFGVNADDQLIREFFLE